MAKFPNFLSKTKIISNVINHNNVTKDAKRVYVMGRVIRRERRLCLFPGLYAGPF